MFWLEFAGEKKLTRNGKNRYSLLHPGFRGKSASLAILIVVFARAFSFSDFLYVFERQRDGKIFQIPVYSNGCKSQSWTKQKLGACSSIWISHVNGRSPSTWAVFCFFPRNTGTGTGSEREKPGARISNGLRSEL